jgi:hypothetical protein
MDDVNPRSMDDSPHAPKPAHFAPRTAPTPRVPPSALKRPRQSWAEYDVDLLDNMTKTKRFASESMAKELVTKMTMATPQAPSPLDPMWCSSAEASPAVACPLVSSAHAPSPTPNVWLTPQRGGKTVVPRPGVPPSMSRAHESVLRRAALSPMSLCEKLPTSPTDPNTESTDLRKVSILEWQVVGSLMSSFMSQLHGAGCHDFYYSLGDVQVTLMRNLVKHSDDRELLDAQNQRGMHHVDAFRDS